MKILILIICVIVLCIVTMYLYFLSKRVKQLKKDVEFSPSYLEAHAHNVHLTAFYGYLSKDGGMFLVTPYNDGIGLRNKQHKGEVNTLYFNNILFKINGASIKRGKFCYPLTAACLTETAQTEDLIYFNLEQIQSKGLVNTYNLIMDKVYLFHVIAFYLDKEVSTQNP